MLGALVAAVASIGVREPSWVPVAGEDSPQAQVVQQDSAGAVAPETSGGKASSSTTPGSSSSAGTRTVAPQATIDVMASADDVLPFDMPSVSTLRSSKHKVFAHYWPPLPISLDNKDTSVDYYARNYLTTSGESGKHAAYGGYLRDRPLTRDPRSESTWRLTDMQTEVRQAIAAGLDGFTLCFMQIPGDPDYQVWENAKLMMQAAAATDSGFKIMLMPDMSGLYEKSQTQLADAIAALAAYPSVYKLDGKIVLSPYQAEEHPASWWSSLLSLLKSKHGLSIAFVPLFHDEQEHSAEFASISVGMSHWGARNPQWNDAVGTYSTSRISRANKVQALGDGKLWMQPVSIQDERPKSGQYEEAENTQNLRNTWKIAMESDSEWVQMVTWNDYSENTHFAPSMKHGYSFLDLNSYYLTWFKRGSAPEIVRDAVYLTHRTQKVSAKPSYTSSRPMKLRGGSDPRDTVEALTFLTQAATVQIVTSAGTTTCKAPAGVSTCLAPLAVGTVKANVVRSSTTVAQAVSPYAVLATPPVQDLMYVGVSSLRQSGASAPNPSASSGGSGGNSGSDGSVRSLALTPTADSYANEGAASKTLGSESSLAAQTGLLSYNGYLRFQFPAKPSGRKLVSASLRVHTTTYDKAGSGSPVDLFVAENSWSESSLNWGSQPSKRPKKVGRLPGGTAPDTSYTIALDVQRINGLLGTQQSFLLKSRGDSLWIWSREYADASARPSLQLTFR